MDFARAMSLEFAPPDRQRFPCLDLAGAALRAGGSTPAALNAANEEAVAAFLDGRVPFPAIAESIREVLEAHPPTPVSDLGDVLAADAWARARAGEALLRRAATGV
jgi:1-deoxy-D-xylulose-5-phosphate reductoisomerase